MDNYVDFLNIEQIYYWIYLLISNIFYYLNPVRWTRIYYDNWPLIMLYSLIFSAILLAGIIYIYNKMKVVKERYSEVFNTVMIPSSDSEMGVLKNERWEKIIRHVNSESPLEWRSAILDADVILEEMLTKIGYAGETLGEKLRQVERSDFLTIDSAWEAHKIRNKVAHEDLDSIFLNQRLVKKTISLYQKVFEEFQYI
ncbi:MAG: hypothetical protein KAJ58_00905 [Candidatus Pacebacteria bacterium]|nr:hypothetical protein [Candidatus Paceibacterota bacterium]